MDIEQQIRLNYLEEASDCLDGTESILLELASTVAEPEQLDKALRLVHSVKGGAGMMGFISINQVAHRLEDFFKILRVRHHSLLLSSEVATLLLQGLDFLRQLITLHRQGKEIEPTGLANFINPVFEQLQLHLGELQDEDENALFCANENADPEMVLFEDEVETILDRFEAQLRLLDRAMLSFELPMTAEKLMIYSKMANLEPFTQLCQSVQQQAAIVTGHQLESLAQQALTTWRRSLALVSRGRIELLPSQLDGLQQINSVNDLLDPDLESIDLSAIEAELTNIDETLIDLFAQTEEPNTVTKPVVTPPQSSKQTGEMVRVPVEQLYQFNSLFEKLIRERNTINLRLDQLINFASLMRQRMRQLEQSNRQLRQWYDRASLEGIVPVNEPVNLTFAINSHNQMARFDLLEMDRYSDLHLISQDQIETIVQLQEVSEDIELGLQEMTQAVRDLNQTTRSLQTNVTKTQMVLFGDVVKHFPRVIRDLSLQFGKPVNLKIEGVSTLIDRAILERLNAPLMHLLRNAFDHGIEDQATRIAAGKPLEGTITLEAVNKGTQTIITIQDDGGGISLDLIGKRLREMGKPEAEINQLSPDEILNYIFEPGFTTSDQVSELSGRGIGMDVVRTNLRDMRGDIRVQTQAGVGTTFVLSIPFSLSILRVMLLERAGIVFAVLCNSVREIVRSPEGMDQLVWNKQTIDVIRLEDSFKFNRPRKPFEMPGNPVINQPTVLIVGEKGTIGAIHIDRFWGEQEVTIRPIESPLPLPLGFISSLVLGDGKVIPLIDPIEIVRGCLEKSGKVTNVTSAIEDQVKRILVVDDSVNVRRYLTLTLEKAGYQVESAKDGQEAVDKLFAGLSVGAVICDIEMPRLDGYGVLEEVKAKSEFKNLPIVMLTSRSNEKHRKLAMNLGASAYFSKPYNEQELLQKLMEFIHYE